MRYKNYIVSYPAI